MDLEDVEVLQSRNKVLKLPVLYTCFHVQHRRVHQQTNKQKKEIC